jgi:hypothetical protein
MPSTDRKLEPKAKTSVAQTGSQPCVYAKGLMDIYHSNFKVLIVQVHTSVLNTYEYTDLMNIEVQNAHEKALCKQITDDFIL